MTERGWVQKTAIAVLLMAAIHLAAPSLCAAAFAIALPADVPQLTTPDADSGSSAPPIAEEDCFCCCPHAKPRPAEAGVEALTPLSESPAVDFPAKPRGDSFPPFHPPRQ